MAAYHRPVVQEKGSGGTIPLLKVLRDVSPAAGFVLWGAEDTARSRIHGTNESVDIAELGRAILAQVLFFEYLARK